MLLIWQIVSHYGRFFVREAGLAARGVLYRHFDNKKAPALLQGPTSIVVFVIRVFVRNVRNLDLV